MLSFNSILGIAKNKRPRLERLHIVEDEADASGDHQLHQHDQQHLAHKPAPHRRIRKRRRRVGRLRGRAMLRPCDMD